MKRVLHLRSSGSFLGAERVVIELANHLPGFGWDPIIGIPLENDSDIPEFYHVAKEHGLKVELFYCRHPYDLGVINTVKDYVKNNGIDLIHSHGYREDLYALGSRKLTGLIATNHLWKKTSWKLWLYATLDAYLLKRFDRVIGVSQPIVQEMQKTGIASEKIALISNGIEIANYAHNSDGSKVRRELGLDTNCRLLVTISSLSHEKGLNYGIEALKHLGDSHPNTHLLIVGDGEEQTNLMALAKQLGVEAKVTFAGRRKDVADILAAADIFLLPSLNEGLPMALLEAMAAGKAIVATSVGDVPAALDKDCGILVEPGDPKTMAEKIIKLIDSPALIHAYGQQALQVATDRYSSEQMTRLYVAEYDGIVDTARQEAAS